MSQRFGASGLWKSYSGRPVLSDASLDVERGQIVGLLGPSGSGKTTLFNILTGIVAPEAGQVFLDDRDITKLTIDGRARGGIGYVPQSPELFPALTAEDNLNIAIEARHGRSDRAGEILDSICRSLLLDAFRGNRLGTLSGGQRKLVEIGFAMCGLPQFLLLDEPFSKLDPITVNAIAARIRALGDAGVGVVLTDHKVRTVLALVSEATVLDNGVTIARGTPQQLVSDSTVRSVFLGEEFVA